VQQGHQGEAGDHQGQEEEGEVDLRDQEGEAEV